MQIVQSSYFPCGISCTGKVESYIELDPRGLFQYKDIALPAEKMQLWRVETRSWWFIMLSKNKRVESEASDPFHKYMKKLHFTNIFWANFFILGKNYFLQLPF